MRLKDSSAAPSGVRTLPLKTPGTEFLANDVTLGVTLKVFRLVLFEFDLGEVIRYHAFCVLLAEHCEEPRLDTSHNSLDHFNMSDQVLLCEVIARRKSIVVI